MRGGTQHDAGLMTVAEFLRLPDPKGDLRRELRHGHAVVVEPPKRAHTRIQKQLLRLLEPLAATKAFATIELPFRPKPEYEVWTADVAVVSRDRWEEETEDDYLSGAPDFVVEVLSPGNTMDDMLDKQEICLANGCRCFWIVDPKRQQVLVTGPQRTTAAFTREMTCPLPAPLDGELSVAAIFIAP
ncbi:MAG: Uma2 family endonuclease [Bryobacteraceae bacterium]|nr:Uma2 family endonuclease [Bryobacteraceae bacterium]